LRHKSISPNKFLPVLAVFAEVSKSYSPSLPVFRRRVLQQFGASHPIPARIAGAPRHHSQNRLYN
jgi:hypothetical protein